MLIHDLSCYCFHLIHTLQRLHEHQYHIQTVFIAQLVVFAHPTLAKLPNNLSSAYVSRVLVCVKQRDSSLSHPTKVNNENVTDPINPSVSVILS